MANTYLITSAQLKSNTRIGGNVDTDYLMNLVYDAQIMVLENVLGTKLYDKIVTDFIADNLAGLYLQMFDDYIKPVLYNLVEADYIRTANAAIKNNGVFTKQPQDAEAADINLIKYTAKMAQSKADVYIDRLDRFLCDQEANISEYTYNQDNDYDIKPKDVSTMSGWYLGDSRQRDNNVLGGGGSGGDYIELE